MPVTSSFAENRLRGQRLKVSRTEVVASYRDRLESLGDSDNVRRALLEALAYLHALAGCDDPATRGTARDAIRSVNAELNPPPVPKRNRWAGGGVDGKSPDVSGKVGVL